MDGAGLEAARTASLTATRCSSTTACCLQPTANAALSHAEHGDVAIYAMVFADLHSTDELVELMQAPALAG